MLLKNKILSGFGAGALICLIVRSVAIYMSSITNNVTDQSSSMSQTKHDLTTAIKAHVEWKSSLEEVFVNNDKK